MGITQTVTILVAVLAFCLVAVTAEIAYVLWRKQRLRHRNVSVSEPDTLSTRGGELTATPSPSKDLLYYSLFCLENKQFETVSEIRSDTAPPLPSITNSVKDVAIKLSMSDNLLCGPSETLFTIAEDCTSETDRAAEKEERGSILVEDDVEVEEGTTTFSTPCGSPPFYTPSPSPGHDYASKVSLYG